MLHGSADAAESVQDTFVVAAATLTDLPEPGQLRPWLFALARTECRRRTRPSSVSRDEADAADQRADQAEAADQRADQAEAEAADQRANAGLVQRIDADPGQRTDKVTRPDDVTTQFRAIGASRGESDDVTMLIPVYTAPDDATMLIPVYTPPDDATTLFRAISDPIEQSPDATTQFRAISDPIEQSADATTQFAAISDSIDSAEELPADGTKPVYMVSQLADATTQFRVVSEPPPPAPDGLADVSGDLGTGYLGQTELRTLIRAAMADLKPREREVIELSFRHDLDDDELAIVLGLSSRRAHALADRARVRLEKSFGAMRTALAGREACPVVGELLADWDGELTEQTRDLVAWHIEQCQTCANHGRGALRPTALSGLLPLAPLPPELRGEVMSCCFAPDASAVGYRRRVVRRAKSAWLPVFSPAVRRLSWDGIRANPGVAIATIAVALWLAAAVIVTLLTFAGSHGANAQVLQSSAGISPSPAASVSAAANVRASAQITPSATVSRTPAHRRAPVQPLLSPSPSNSPALSPTPALPPSPKPSQSAKPSPKPSQSAKPSPKPSKSPSPTPPKSPSPSPSTSATPGRQLA
jgi:DNA-directed RNA polymerase specialized sigma24 family protein